MTQQPHVNSSMNFPALANFAAVSTISRPSSASAAILENGQPTLLSSTKQLMNIIAKHPYHPHGAANMPNVTAAASLPQAANTGAIGFGNYFSTAPMSIPSKFYSSTAVGASSIYATVSPPSMPIHLPIPALIPGNVFFPSQISLQIPPTISSPPTLAEPLMPHGSSSTDFHTEKKQPHIGDNVFSTCAPAVISPSEALSSSPSSPSQSLEAMSLSSLSTSSSPSSLPDEEMHLAETQEENSTVNNGQLLPIGGVSVSNSNFKAEDATKSFMFHPNNFLIEDYDIYAADVFSTIPSHEELLHQQQQLPPLSIAQQTPKEPPHRLNEQDAKMDSSAHNMTTGTSSMNSELSPLPLATIEQNATSESNLIYDFFTNPVAQMSATHLLIPVPPAQRLSTQTSGRSGHSGHSDDEFILVEDSDGLP